MNRLQFESNVRKTLDLVIAVLVGVLSELFWDWKWLLIIIGVYSLLKANVLYNKLRKIPPEQYMSEEDFKYFYSMDDFIERRKQLHGYRAGYTRIQCIIQLLLTFTIVGGISSMIKLLLAWTISSTLWLTIFIIMGCLTMYMTIKRIWG